MNDLRDVNLNRKNLVYRQLSSKNIQEVYKLFEENSAFFSLPFDYFKRGTLDDDGVDFDLSLILYEVEKEKPIAGLIVAIRNISEEKKGFIKGCVVDKKYRRQRIGTLIFDELLKRAKVKGIKKITYGPAVPNYWQPGVDIRNTSLYFFLKKHRFKSHRAIYNLTVSLDVIKNEPVLKKEGYKYERVQPEDFDKIYDFVKQQFPNNTWAAEVKFSLHFNPPTTFIAKNAHNNIVGWATHSQFFPGSFGPTGVKESLRGKGIGTILFLWCLWDIKQKGLEKSEIMWVVGDTIKFYSKVIGAYISPIFYPMYKKIR
ncbi:MAG: GNAT family N-acetyltransferase [Candidatus Lokiarchaeota archaeon]|nr:GNAT family N-acetyltransferase [Candidatus Lokiarchaeota archaeon]